MKSYINKKKAAQIIKNCLNEMYVNSEPSITWEECEEKYKNIKDWYMQHKITEDKYNHIYDKYIKQLPKPYHNTLQTILLNYAPTFSRSKK